MVVTLFSASKRHWLYLLCILLFSLLAAAPLWLIAGLPNSDDSLTHVFNLFALDRLLQAGLWPPLRFAERGLGYGYAVLAYYPPLPYTLLETLHLLGADYVLSFKLGLTLITILAGFSMFWLGQQLFDAETGLVMAWLYLFNPYFLANLHLRGALAEHLGLAIGPLLFVAITQLIQSPGWRASLLISLSVALLSLAHFVSTLLYLPFAVAYALWLLRMAPPGNRWHRFGGLVLAVLLGGLLSSFYWVPAALERSGLNRFDPTAALHAYLAEMLPVTGLLRPTSLIAYQNPHQMPELGLPLMILLLASAVILYRMRKLATALEQTYGYFGLGATLVALGWATTVAAPLWRWLPPIAILQFPFRWLGPATLFCAVLIGAAWQLWRRQPARGWLLISAMLLLLWYGIAALPNLPRQPAQLRSSGVAQVTAQEITLAGLMAYEHDQADNWRKACWFWAYEYIPASSSLSRCTAMRDLILDSPALTKTLPAVSAQIQPHWMTPNGLAAHVAAEQPWPLTLHAFWIPGWQATIDGQVTASAPLDATGMVGIQVPAGEHEVVLRYGLTRLRQSMLLLAGLVLAVWLLLAIRYQRRFAFAALSIGLLLTFLLGWRLPRTLAPTLQPVNYSFGHALALQAYGITTQGNQLRLDLTWFARQSTGISYKVFVHVIDDTGKLWTQDDSRPLHYSSNTNRWLPGQAILDVHELTLPDQLPPGNYQVRTGLYAEQDGQRLPVTDEQGDAIGDQVLLQQVTIASQSP